MNRRTRRTVVVTAVLVLLLAGVVGELAFGSRGSVLSAEAATAEALAVDVSTSDSREGVLSDSSGEVETVPELSEATVSDDSANEGSSTAASNAQVREVPSTVSVGAPATPGAEVVGAPAAPATETVGGGDVPAPSGGDDHSHGVDDHAVEHSDQHDESEAVSHGHDEDAHQEHGSLTHS